ncbi:ATP-binding protein [Amaricoccus sp.]|uniref:sensor histidine kinase n=1 Tax=Amaricoccus sp. TaxID=1872485 RepID=UPI001B5B9BB0|nr:ATP-binding protein [Amaricoccus sp.]MBP7000558.1 hypothetical protein [Amaricoccus sp.]
MHQAEPATAPCAPKAAAGVPEAAPATRRAGDAAGFGPELLILAATFATALACRALGFGEGALLGATPASGVALFAAVIRRRRGAAAAAAGFWLAGLAGGLAPAPAAIDAAAHGIAALAGAATMRSLARRRAERSRTSDWLILLAGVGVFSATVAAAFLAAGLAGAPVAPPTAWKTAFLALVFEPLGLLIAGAAIASLGEAHLVRGDLRPALVTAALGLALLGGFRLLLDAPLPGPSPSGVLLASAIPFCVWIAMQKRSLDGAALSFFMALAALVMLLARVGTVAGPDFVTAVIYLTVLVAVCQLVHAVNRDRLAALAEVEARKRDLEARVAERTARLAAMTERALAADAAKTRFLATVSHEVRTPLNGILGMASVVLAEPGLEPSLRNSVATIRTSGVHLLDVITRLLDFTRLESRRGETEAESFDLGALVEEVLVEARFLPYAGGLRLAADIAPGLPRRRVGQRLGLRQVLTNLVGNAAKFTEAGSVTVVVRPLAGDGLRIEVRDTGEGVPAEARERIFLPYEQAPSGRHVGGSGLGLAICAEVVRRMGGRIGVEDAPGGGSTFWIEVALRLAAPAEPAGQPIRS